MLLLNLKMGYSTHTKEEDMSKFELEFLDDLKQPVPAGIIARVRVATMRGDGNSPPRCITSDCAFRKEFDEQIDRLIAELEKIRAQGHRKFAAYDAQ